MRRVKRTICKKQHDWLRMIGVSLLTFVWLFISNTCQADTTQTWDVSMICTPTEVFPCNFNANLTATMTTVLETGDFYDITAGELLTDVTVPVVTSMEGNFNGEPVSLVISLDPQVGWLFGGEPEDVEFTSDGIQYNVWLDGVVYLGEYPQLEANKEIVMWSAVDPVPEPGTLVLLACGLLAFYWLGGLKVFKRAA